MRETGGLDINVSTSMTFCHVTFFLFLYLLFCMRYQSNIRYRENNACVGRLVVSCRMWLVFFKFYMIPRKAFLRY